MNPTIRAHWAHLQGLDGSLAGATAHDVLVHSGWTRSVGGAGPYLALHARAGLSRAAVDAAVAAAEICELPSARGCTYIVPKADYAVALAAGQGHGDAAQIQAAKKYCGVTDAEIDTLCVAILDVLDEPLDPKDLKDRVGGAVRHLGDIGKKKGVTTTLSLGLGRLQSRGEIRRIPANGRLDQQRYLYRRWSPSPLAGRSFAPDELAVELARRFFRWIGPASVDQLAWWGGLSKKAAKAAVASLELVPFDGDDGTLVMSAADRERLRSFEVPREPHVRLVGSLDNLAHLRREVGPLVDDPSSIATGAERGSTVLDLPHHAVIDRGRLVGLWDYDVAGREIVVRTFGPTPGIDEAVAHTTRFVRDDLGDARSFSLDSPESRTDRLAALRA